MKKFASYNEKDTFSIGAELAAKLKKGDVVACFGDLGSGKTALTRGIASFFDIQGVHSPTFTLVNEYYNDKITLYHFDAYRINKYSWLDSGFDEYLYSDGICIIEWAENVIDILPADVIKVTFSQGDRHDENYREITIEGEKFENFSG